VTPPSTIDEPAVAPPASRSKKMPRVTHSVSRAVQPPAKKSSTSDTIKAIKTAFGKRDYGGALRECTAFRRHNSETRSACAIAACGADRPSDAKKFARGLSSSRRIAVTRTCLARGVSLDR
jgi:hypothetical protein